MVSNQHQYVSDELFHFVDRSLGRNKQRYNLLLKILESGKLLSSKISLKNLRQDHWTRNRNGELTEVPAICFCDIPRPGLGLHTGKYSQFGLSFKKEFLARRGAKPVIYVPLKSKPTIGVGNRGHDTPIQLRNTLRQLSGRERDFVTREFYLFVKLFDESLDPQHEKNYYMEREWRVVGASNQAELKFELKDVSAVMVPPADRDRLLGRIPSLANRIIKQRCRTSATLRQFPQ